MNLISHNNPGVFVISTDVEPSLVLFAWVAILVFLVLLGLAIYAAAKIDTGEKAPWWSWIFAGGGFAVVALVVGTLVSFVVAAVTLIGENHDARAAWTVEVSEWLADDYGVNATPGNLDGFLGDGHTTRVDGEVRHVRVVETLEGELVVVFDNEIPKPSPVE